MMRMRRRRRKTAWAMKRGKQVSKETSNSGSSSKDGEPDVEVFCMTQLSMLLAIRMFTAAAFMTVTRVLNVEVHYTSHQLSAAADIVPNGF